MTWWTKPVEWLGRKETKDGTTKDGRLIRVFTRSIGKKIVVTQVYAQCSKCGDWITETENSIVVKDALGSTRNEHKKCNVA